MPQGRFHYDKSGNRYGMLTLVTMLNKKNSNGSYKYITQCDCGESKAIFFNQMSRGNVTSCGCKQRLKGELSTSWKHGNSRTKDYQINYQMNKNYGIGLKEYDAMFNSQKGVCAICSQDPPNNHKKRLNVDHCHSTGKIRGLLCDACNRAIGLLKDSPDLLNKAISYLAR